MMNYKSVLAVIPARRRLDINAVALLGLRQLMVNGDLKGIDENEQVWRARQGEPIIPNFVHKAVDPGGNKYSFHTRLTSIVESFTGKGS